MKNQCRHHRLDLVRIANDAMTERGLLPEFSAGVQHQLNKISAQAVDAELAKHADMQDLRHLLWCSLDNDDSEDLDQLTVSETLPDGKAALGKEKPPYSTSELGALAMHCTAQEDAAQKVERRLRKSEAALLLENRIGQYFDGVITGSSS